MKEISDTEIFRKLKILKPMRELAQSKNFIHLWRGFCELALEYIELRDNYKALTKRVRKAIQLDASATYPVALPHLWRGKSNNQLRSSNSIPKNKRKRGKSGG